MCLRNGNFSGWHLLMCQCFNPFRSERFFSNSKGHIYTSLMHSIHNYSICILATEHVYILTLFRVGPKYFYASNQACIYVFMYFASSQ